MKRRSFVSLELYDEDAEGLAEILEMQWGDAGCQQLAQEIRTQLATRELGRDQVD